MLQHPILRLLGAFAPSYSDDMHATVIIENVRILFENFVHFLKEISIILLDMTLIISNLKNKNVRRKCCDDLWI